MKEMSGTPEFLDLDDKVKKCQNEETILECRSRKYLDIGEKECGCIPHHLRSFHKKVTNHIAAVQISKHINHCHCAYWSAK